MAKAKTNAKKEALKKAWGKTHHTGVGRLIFPSIDEPTAFTDENGKAKGEKKFSASVVVPPSDNLSAIMADIDAVGRKAFPDWDENQDYYRPIVTGESILERSEKANEDLYKGKFRILAKGAEDKDPPQCYLADKSLMPRRPGNVDDLKRIKETFYEGCYARLAVTPFAFRVGDSEGVGLIFKGIQFVKDGAKLGRVDIGQLFEAEFGDIPEDEVGAGFSEPAEGETVTDVNI